jgi:hypothetical protein
MHRKMRAISFIAIGLIMLSGCAGVKYDPVEATTLQEGQQQQVEVLGAGDWRDTGIVVHNSETYELSASGTWNMGGICGTTDASGAGVNPFCAGDPWALGATGSTLIGRIGSTGNPFRVGDNFTLKPKTEGNLYLRSYDLIPFDNTGAVNVTILRQGITVASAPAAAKPVQEPTPVTQTLSSAEPSGFSSNPMSITFIQGPARPDDIAVIIGNADYKKQGKDIPNVKPAYSDAATFKRYAMTTLGIREGNIIDMHDATGAQMNRVFGTDAHQQGQLSDWVRKDISNVYVYYAGHGAPGGNDGNAYLIPSDADASRIEINGYGLKTLYSNLGRLPAKSVTVVLEACFSGSSQAGAVISNASPVFLKAKTPDIPSNITVIAAGASDQMASWENDGSNGLFTKYYLKGVSGEADADADGIVTNEELKAYLQETLTYYARRYYGRDQTAVIVVGDSQ